MLLGYNTNGFAHHDPFQAVELLAQIGYRSVAITLDHGRLNPFEDDFGSQLVKLKELLQRLEMEAVIETGAARFLLNPKQKHEPTLLSADPVARQQRIDFLCRCIDAAAALNVEVVSLWSGALREELASEQALERLTVGLRKVLHHATDQGIQIGFEPEPGMFIDTMSSFNRLLQWIDVPHLAITLDVGHLYCLGEVPITDVIAKWGPRVVNVHLEDMRAGVHEHLMFGEGEMDFPPILQALQRTGYNGGVHVELSRHSHMAPQAAQQAYDFLKAMFEG